MSAALEPVPDLSQAEAVRLLGLLLKALESGALPLAVDSDTAAKMLGISTKTLHLLPVKSVRMGHRTRRYAVMHILQYLDTRAKV